MSSTIYSLGRLAWLGKCSPFFENGTVEPKWCFVSLLVFAELTYLKTSFLMLHQNCGTVESNVEWHSEENAPHKTYHLVEHSLSIWHEWTCYRDV